jgi:hypothetical protein
LRFTMTPQSPCIQRPGVGGFRQKLLIAKVHVVLRVGFTVVRVVTLEAGNPLRIGAIEFRLRNRLFVTAFIRTSSHVDLRIKWHDAICSFYQHLLKK